MQWGDYNNTRRFPSTRFLHSSVSSINLQRMLYALLQIIGMSPEGSRVEWLAVIRDIIICTLSTLTQMRSLWNRPWTIYCYYSKDQKYRPTVTVGHMHECTNQSSHRWGGNLRAQEMCVFCVITSTVVYLLWLPKAHWVLSGYWHTHIPVHHWWCDVVGQMKLRVISNTIVYCLMMS